MEDKSCGSSKILNQEDDETSNAVKLLESKGEPVPGDVMWVKLRGDSWWPAVVFESNTKKNVCVRLFGSNEYMHVNPIKWRSEFRIALEKNNGSCKEIFRKALEQDISRSNSRRSKRKAAKSEDGKKANGKAPRTAEGGKSKSSKKDKDVALSGRSPELSARRTKVMQTLGLIAPSGSPFHKMDRLV